MPTDPLAVSIIVPNPVNGLAPLLVKWTATVTGGAMPATYSWDFGDGETSTDIAPEHTFVDDAEYTVELTVTDSAGETASASRTFVVGASGLFPNGNGPQCNADGSLRKFTPDEIRAMKIQTRGVRDGSHPTHRRGMRGCSTDRSFYCATAHFESFLAYMLGAVRTYTNADGKIAVSRLLPQTFPKKDRLTCMSLAESKGQPENGAGVDNADGVPTYPRTECRFLYEVVPYYLKTDLEMQETGKNESDRYLEELGSKIDVKYLTLPGGSMRLATGAVDANRAKGTPIPYAIGSPQVTSNYALKVWRFPYAAWGAGSARYELAMGVPGVPSKAPYIGSVNATTFFGNPPGTLLLLDVEEEIMFDQLGDDLVWNLTFRFLKKPRGHNWFFFFQTNPQGTIPSGWYFASIDGEERIPGNIDDDTSLFNEREFADLFATAV